MEKPRRRKAKLILPRHGIDAEDLLNFVELRSFSRDWDAFRFGDEELGRLQIEIMADPKRWPVIEGTDGLRKMRYAPSRSSQGKRGNLRICYVYFESFHTVLLVVVYSKSQSDDIPEGMKRRINAAIARIKAALEKRYS